MNKITKILGATTDSINRQVYIITHLKVYLIWFVFEMITDTLSNSSPSLTSLLIILGLAIVVFISGMIVIVDTTKARLKNIGKETSLWPLIIVPFVNIIFFIYLCIKKGAK